MSKSIKGVAGNAESLTSSAEEASAAIQEIVASISQVAANAENVNKLSNKVKDETKTGERAVQDTLAAIGEISEAISRAGIVMTNLGESSEKIGSIT